MTQQGIYVAVEARFPDSDEAVALAVALDDREAWRFPVHLWRSQMLALNERGLIKFPPWKIAELSKFSGDPELYFKALLDTGLLRPRKGGAFYMAGWSRNRRFFKERKRLAVKQKRYRDKKKKTGDDTGNVTGNVEGDVPRDRSRSRSRSLDLDPISPERPLPVTVNPTREVVAHEPVVEDRVTLDDVAQGLSNHRLRAHIDAKAIARFHRLTKTEPVRRHELEEALRTTVEKAETKPPRFHPDRYLMGCLEGQRDDAEAERNRKPAAKAAPRKESATMAGTRNYLQRRGIT